jgi:eukaryotic-like serine/threonine-protein kinase
MASAPGPGRDPATWRFVDAELDEARLELRVRGKVVPLERKPLELLMVLLRHPGEVLTKDELLDAVWGGRVLSETVLSRAMTKLRQALGDEEQSLVKTVHGYGYRLMAAVTRLTPPASATSPPFSGLRAGQSPPLRVNWRLVSRYAGARGESWLAEHSKTREKRVFKFATGADGLGQLKREITIFRLLLDTLGPREDIVRILDWNLAEPPFFIEIEHCQGGDLVAWSERRGGLFTLPLEDRLDLAIQAAEAVAAAHSAGVLHKDLKPANLLIVGDSAERPRLRLGDFGSGRVIEPERLQAAQITRMGFTQSVLTGESTSGTWSYIAPEQLSGQPPTVRADVYALGVLLYQLVVGDLRRPLAPGWERDVDDELLREDIAAAADHDPDRRLGAAAELARRLRGLDARRAEREAQRTLAAEAEVSRRALERARARRSRLTLVTAVSVVVAAVTGSLYLQVERSRGEARRQADAAKAVSEFLVRDMISAADPMLTGRRDASVRAVLDQASAEAGERFAGEPALEAAVRRSLGESLVGIGEPHAAVAEFLRAAELRAESEPLERARDLHAAGASLLDTGDYAAAADSLSRALVHSPDGEDGERLRVLVRSSQAWLAHLEGRSEDAAHALEQLGPATEATFGAASSERAQQLEALGQVYHGLGRFEEAVAVLGQALRKRIALHGEDHPQSIRARSSLGASLIWLRHYEAAEHELRATVDLARASLGPDHHLTLAAQAELALALQEGGDPAAALPLLEDALERRRRAFGEHDKDTTSMMNNVALLRWDLGQPREGLKLLLRSYAIDRELLGESHPATLTALQNIGRLHQEVGEWTEARAVQERLLPLARAALPADHWHVGVMLVSYGDTLRHFGERDAAHAALTEALALLEPAVGRDSPPASKARRLLADLNGYAP